MKNLKIYTLGAFLIAASACSSDNKPKHEIDARYIDPDELKAQSDTLNHGSFKLVYPKGDTIWQNYFDVSSAQEIVDADTAHLLLIQRYVGADDYSLSFNDEGILSLNTVPEVDENTVKVIDLSFIFIGAGATPTVTIEKKISGADPFKSIDLESVPPSINDGVNL
ncbi:MAG: hypothetical protein AAF182_03105 [Pseudomonadota bacterium]